MDAVQQVTFSENMLQESRISFSAPYRKQSPAQPLTSCSMKMAQDVRGCTETLSNKEKADLEEQACLTSGLMRQTILDGCYYS